MYLSIQTNKSNAHSLRTIFHRLKFMDISRGKVGINLGTLVSYLNKLGKSPPPPPRHFCAHFRGNWYILPLIHIYIQMDGFPVYTEHVKNERFYIYILVLIVHYRIKTGWKGHLDTCSIPAFRSTIWSFWHSSIKPSMRLANSTTYCIASVIFTAQSCHITSLCCKKEKLLIPSLRFLFFLKRYTRKSPIPRIYDTTDERVAATNHRWHTKPMHFDPEREAKAVFLKG